MPVNSSSIKDVDYSNGVLTVEFHNGRVYQHSNVPTDVYEDMMVSESVGKFYVAQIRGKYAHREVTEN